MHKCERSSQAWQTIILSSLCGSDPRMLLFFLFLLLYFLPLDIYLGIHLFAYSYIDVSIYLFYLPDLLFLSVRPPASGVYRYFHSFFCFYFGTFVSPLLFPMHVLFLYKQPTAIPVKSFL